MGYVAAEELRWGDGWIAVGETVPENEEGRDYAALLRHGKITRMEEMGDAELRAALEKVTAERDALAARVEELEAAQGGDAEASSEDGSGDDAHGDGDELPDGVTDAGGGWYELPGGKKVRKKDIAKALAEASSEE